MDEKPIYEVIRGFAGGCPTFNITQHYDTETLGEAFRKLADDVEDALLAGRQGYIDNCRGVRYRISDKVIYKGEEHKVWGFFGPKYLLISAEGDCVFQTIPVNRSKLVQVDE